MLTTNTLDTLAEIHELNIVRECWNDEVIFFVISSQLQSLVLKYTRYILLGLLGLGRLLVRVLSFFGALVGVCIRILVGFTLIPLYQIYHGVKSNILAGVMVRAKAVTFKHVLSHSSQLMILVSVWIGVAALAVSANATANEQTPTLLLESTGEVGTGSLSIEYQDTHTFNSPEDAEVFTSEPNALMVGQEDVFDDAFGIDDHGSLYAEAYNSTEETPRTRVGVETYVVQAGDTISGIAYAFGLNATTVMWANGFNERTVLKPNASLTILPTDGVLYTVTKGDTVSRIAKRYGISEDSIISFNNEGSTIVPGTNIVLPNAKPLRTLVQNPSRNSGGAASAGQLAPKRSTSSGYLWPTPGKRVNQYYSWRHNGLDIDNNTDNDPVYAAESGTILKAGWNNGGYGNRVLIQHTGNTQTNYGHLKKVLVKAGDRVQKGDVIGIMGTTGRSTGVHLHFEIIINGRRLNPLSYLQ